MGAAGWFGVSSSFDITTRPPQHSTTASRPLSLQPAKNASRPPEQVPKMPTFPLRFGSARSQAIAPSRSPSTRASGAPPAARTLAPTSSGVPWPSRWYRFGEIEM